MASRRQPERVLQTINRPTRDTKAFRREISVPESYATEFTKMISLAILMREQGARIV